MAEVKDLQGNVLYTGETTGERTVDEDIAADATYALSKVVSEGTARSIAQLGYPAAGKTGTRAVEGTTQAAWFTGTTMQIATAVDFVAGEAGTGNLDDYSQWGGTFYGSSYPAATWLAYMRVAMQGQTSLPFPPPANVNGNSQGTASPTYVPSPTPTPTPSESMEPTPTPTPTPTETPEPTQEPTETATAEPTPTQTPSGGGTTLPTSKPTAT